MILRIKTNRGGIIRSLIIFALVLVLLAYFGFNLRGIVASQTFQDNWSFIKEISINIWANYLSIAFHFIWDNLLMPIFNKFNTAGGYTLPYVTPIPVVE
jgi:hypothetical protein